ncbi:MAG: phosphoglycerate dehydrogenase [Clostridiales bacterium]|nr:phosphoglycerate dehydrogenase [Clostridiales bacterium]
MIRKVAFPFRHHASLVCAEAKQMLTDAGFELVCNDTGRKLDRDEQKAMIADAYAIIAGTEPYDADMLSACKELKVMVRFGVGTDNFDLKTMREMGVQVGVIANHNAVAEFALTLLLSTLKNVPLYDTAVRNAGWNRYTMRELSGKTVGLMGFGRIGRRLAQLLSGFGTNTIAYDPFMNEEAAKQLNVKPVSFDELLAQSDIVSLHLPMSPETRHIINEDTLAKMKDGAILINTARGGLVSEKALVAALESGKLAGAGLDVYETEPVTPGNPLYGIQNTVLSPHVSALSIETNFEAGMTCARSILQVSEGGKPVYPLW